MTIYIISILKKKQKIYRDGKPQGLRLYVNPIKFSNLAFIIYNISRRYIYGVI